MSNPVLFIIAGPNGSGKSLFSKKLTTSDLEVFDGDKHMAALIKNIQKRVVKRCGHLLMRIFLKVKSEKY